MNIIDARLSFDKPVSKAYKEAGVPLHKEESMAGRLGPENGLLGRIVSLAIRLVESVGEETHRKDHGSHIHVIRKLTLDRVELTTSLEQTRYGDNNVIIKVDGAVILDVHYRDRFSAKTCDVVTYVEDEEKWLEYTRLMANGSSKILRRLREGMSPTPSSRRL